MNKPLLLLLGILFSGGPAIAQNTIPQISIVNINDDGPNSELTITYDLGDPDNGDISIQLKISDNGGLSYTIPVQDVSGDVGFPVSPGNGKSLVWDYSGVGLTPGMQQLMLIADDLESVDIADIVAQVEPENLIYNMSVLEGVRNYGVNPVFMESIKDTIEKRFEDASLLAYRQPFSAFGFNSENILGRHAGLGSDTLSYIIDAHFDGVAISPGADDNASGVLGVLEAARILSQYHFDKSIAFIAFDLEESGLIGSNRYVNDGGIQEWERIEGVFNMEMIGYYSDEPNSQSIPFGFDLVFPDEVAEIASQENRGNFITNVSNTASDPIKEKFAESAALYVPELRVISLSVPGTGGLAPDLRRSDHASFWDQNIKALMITDGAEYRNTNYHSGGDVSDILDYNFMAQVIQTIIASVADLAEPRHAGVAIADIDLSTAIPGYSSQTCKISLNPNPAKDRIQISVADCGEHFDQLTIMDSNGRVLRRERGKYPSASSFTLDLSELPGGLYFISLEKGSLKVVEKFIRE